MGGRGAYYVVMARRPSPELAALRAQVIRAHKNATRKVSRLRNQVGVELSGSNADVRRPLSKVRKYNATQLTKYAAELQQFNSRGAQYVRGAGRQPISGDLWKRYQGVESRVHAIFNAQYEKYKDLKLPRGDETVNDRMWKMRPKHRAMANMAVNSMFDPVKRASKGVMSDKALVKLIGEQENKLKPEYISKRIAEHRDTVEKLMDVVGDAKLGELVGSLNDEQFFVLFEYSGFVESLSTWYEITMMATAKRLVWHDTIQNDMFEDTWLLAKWAKKLSFGR